MSLLKRVAMISALGIVSSFAMEDPQGGGRDAPEIGKQLPPVELVRDASNDENARKKLLEGNYELDPKKFDWDTVPQRERGRLIGTLNKAYNESLTRKKPPLNVANKIGEFREGVQGIYKADETIAEQEGDARELIRNTDGILRDIFATMDKIVNSRAGYDEAIEAVKKQIESIQGIHKNLGELNPKFQENYTHIDERLKEIQKDQGNLVEEILNLKKDLEVLNKVAEGNLD